MKYVLRTKAFVTNAANAAASNMEPRNARRPGTITRLPAKTRLPKEHLGRPSTAKAAAGKVVEAGGFKIHRPCMQT